MDHENKYKASNADATPEEKDAPAEPNKHKYRLLGESGLVEDEDGNVYDASEIDDSSDLDGLTSSEISSRIFPPKTPKDNMPDWAAIYDPRYCGPSREAYIEKMTKEYRSKHSSKTQANDDLGNTTDNQKPGIIDEWLKCNNVSTDTDAQVAEEIEPPHATSFAPTGVVFGKDPSVNSEPSEESSKEKKDGSEQNQDLSPKKRKHDPNNWFGLHLKTRDVVFYAVGAIALIAYFIFLIYLLISKIVDLF